MPAIEAINPDTLPDAPSMGYSQITTVTPGKMIFISGQVAWQPDGTPPPATLTEQATIAASNLGKALEAAGATPENIVSARMFVVDFTLERSQQAFGPIMALFNGHKSAFTAVGVTSLAAPDLMIEIEAIAVV
ncbi:MAG: RidA family protein [Pseudomonadota bacterium]